MTRSTRRRRWPYVLLALVVLLLGGAGGAAYGLGWVDYWQGLAKPATPPAKPLAFAALKPGIATVAQPVDPANTPPLQRARIAAALARPLGDRHLGRHVVAEVAPLTGAAVFTHGSGTATPASLTKLLTTTAALEVLGPDRRFTTQVTRQGRTVTLVGGGDPLLDSDDLAALATQTAAKLHAAGVRRVRLHYDATLFTGPSVDPRWRPTYIPEEIVPVSALSVDEGHTPGPDGQVGTPDDGRSLDPAAATADAFRALLAAHDISVTGAPAPARRTGAVVASIAGDTVSAIVEHTLQVSDNQAAENLARHVGLADQDGSFAGAVRGVVQALGRLGVPTSGITLYDGSGLSRQDRIAPGVIIRVLQVASSPEHPELSAVLSGLPVAGFSGSLRERFEMGAAAGDGFVRAKTGTLTRVSGLAGIVTDRRGTPMVAVVIADRFAEKNVLDVRQTLDEALASLAACHCS